MFKNQPELTQPITVVMFGSGPELTHDARQFLCQLEAHPQITFLGAFCQSQAQTGRAVFVDLWRRRGILAFPLFLARIIRKIVRYLENPQAETTLKQQLSELSSRIHFVENIHAPDVVERVRALKPDLGLIYGSPILKPQVFEIPRLGTLGIHHGKVPDYRGNKTTFWAIYNGESAAGVTIQKVNRGLDTGSIVKEGEVPIGHRSYSAVVRDLEALGLMLFIQAILEVKNGTAVFRPQPAEKKKLYKNPRPRDFLVFWLRRLRRRLANSPKSSGRKKGRSIPLS